MRRVIVISWKPAGSKDFNIFSSLKILCHHYPKYNYNTLNNYLSKKKIPFENDEVKIERKIVYTKPTTVRQITAVAARVKMHGHDEEKQNLEYWLSRPVEERLEAVTRLSAQLKKRKNQRMDKSVHRKIKMR